MSGPEHPFAPAFKALAETLAEAGDRIFKQFNEGIKRMNDHLREARENPEIRESYRELERERRYEQALKRERIEAKRWLADYTARTRREMGLEP